MFPLEKRKTPVFTEAKRRPGIPDPLDVRITPGRLVVKERRERHAAVLVGPARQFEATP